MTDYTLNLVDAIISGRATDIETAFQEAITDKISIAMETKRTEIAQSMFTKESAGAYETWDPKHPKFKEKLIKHHAKGGTTKSFIDQEKAKAWKQLTRESVEDEELTLEDYSLEEIEDFMMSEDFEQLDEVSKKTLGSYVTKAHDQLMKHTAASNFKSGRGDADAFAYSRDEKTMRKEKNRKAGVATAIGKLTKEEVEELDEISKATLGSYVKKASVDAAVHTDKFGRGGAGVTYSNTAGVADKRLKGVSKAVDKLTKEEFTLEDYSVEELEDFMMSEDFEQLDELSKATLSSYVNKASANASQNAFNSGGAYAQLRSNQGNKDMTKTIKRLKNVGKAVVKLTKEEVEELDEISKATLGSYVKKAGSDRSGAGFRAGMAAGQGKDSPYNYDANIKIASKREKGINKAVDKLTKEEFTLEDYSLEELEDFMVSEDFEQLDELSKATLGSYVKKASGKLASHGTNLMGSVGNFNIKNAEYHGTKIDKRQKGISKAVDKLTK